MNNNTNFTETKDQNNSLSTENKNKFIENSILNTSENKLKFISSVKRDQTLSPPRIPKESILHNMDKNLKIKNQLVFRVKSNNMPTLTPYQKFKIIKDANKKILKNRIMNNKLELFKKKEFTETDLNRVIVLGEKRTLQKSFNLGDNNLYNLPKLANKKLSQDFSLNKKRIFIEYDDRSKVDAISKFLNEKIISKKSLFTVKNPKKSFLPGNNYTAKSDIVDQSDSILKTNASESITKTTQGAEETYRTIHLVYPGENNHIVDIERKTFIKKQIITNQEKPKIDIKNPNNPILNKMRIRFKYDVNRPIR